MYFIPIAGFYSAVKIVSAGENQNGVDVVSVFFFQQLRLRGQIFESMAVYTVDIRDYAERFLQKLPIILFCADMAFVGDGVAEECDFF